MVPAVLYALSPPAQSVVGDAADTLLGIAFLVLALVPAGLVVAGLWIPFAASARVRRLFETGPTNHWMGNYVAGFVVVGAVHTALLFWTLTNAPTDDAVASIVVLGNPAFVLAVWAVAAFALPAIGYDWVEDAVVSRLFLFLGAVWYAAMTTVPLFVAIAFYCFPGE